MRELKSDLERKLRDPATPIAATQYVRGVLDGIDKILAIPANEVRKRQRQALERQGSKESRTAGIWPTRPFRKRQPRTSGTAN